MMRNQRAIFFALGALLLFWTAGCGSKGKVSAVVNGQVITVQDVERRISNLSPALRGAGGDRPRVLEQMVLETVLLQEAQRRGLNRDSEVVRLMGEARRQILLGRLIELVREEQKAGISDDQLQQFDDQTRASFLIPQSYRASHILLNTEEAAKKALARIRGGEAFEQVAKEVSADPSKDRGGDIGFFTSGQVIPEFEQACKKLKPGEVSEVVKTPLGYHLILLTEEKPAGQQPFEEVKDHIRRSLETQQRQRMVEAFVKDLREKSQIQVREAVPPSAKASSPPDSAPSAPSEPPPASSPGS